MLKILGLSEVLERAETISVKLEQRNKWEQSVAHRVLSESTKPMLRNPVVRLASFCLCLLMLSANASAELYKCSDASGAVTYQGTPCVDLDEEVITVQPSPQTPPHTPPPDANPGGDEQRPAEGKPSSARSPLARAHAGYLRALSSCRKSSLLSHLSNASRAQMEEMSAIEFRATCEIMKQMDRNDYSSAMETYDGDKASLVWREKTEERDGNETFRAETTETVRFVKENGAWVIGK